MKFTTKKLAEALSIATRCCGGNLPILQTVMIEGRDGRIHVTSTNLDQRISTSIEAEVDKPMSVCILGRRLTGIVGSMPNEASSITVNERSSLQLKGGGSRFDLFGVSANEFPPSPKTSNPINLKIEKKSLRALIRSVAVCQSDDSHRSNLNGVNLAMSEGTLWVVATDGRRLHAASVAHEAESFNVILPRKAVDLITPLLEGDGSVKIVLSVGINGIKTILFTIDRPDGEVCVWSKLTDANFPNWRQVRLTDCDTKVEVVRQTAIDAVKRASLACDEKSTAIKLTFLPTSIKITASSATGGDSSEEIECKSIERSEGKVDVAMNFAFLLDTLRSIESEKVTIRLNGKSDVTPLGLEQGSWEAVIMPVRFK